MPGTEGSFRSAKENGVSPAGFFGSLAMSGFFGSLAMSGSSFLV